MLLFSKRESHDDGHAIAYPLRLGTGYPVSRKINPMCSTHIGSICSTSLLVRITDTQACMQSKDYCVYAGSFRPLHTATHIVLSQLLYYLERTNNSLSTNFVRRVKQKLYSGVQHSLQECKGVWRMPRLQEAMKDVEWLR